MPKAEYIRKINQSSLMITPEKEYESEKDSIEMFRHHQIPDFLKMKVQKKNTFAQFCYDITSKRSLEQLLEYKSLDYLLLLKILSSFDDACTQTEDFMMTEDDILLKPEFVFADHNLDQMSYCYVPGNHTDICLQFQAFMGYLLQHLDHKDELAVRLAYYVYQRVAEERTALHDVLRDDRFRQFEQDVEHRQTAQGADVNQWLYQADASRMHQQQQERFMENKWQQSEGSYEKHTGKNPLKIMEEPDQQSAFRTADQEWMKGSSHMDFNEIWYTTDNKEMRGSVRQQELGDSTQQQDLRDTTRQQDLRDTTRQKDLRDSTQQQELKDLTRQQEVGWAEDDCQIQYRPDKKRKIESQIEDGCQIQYTLDKKRKIEKSAGYKHAGWQETGKFAAAAQESDTTSKIEKKATIRKQAAEKLKKMLCRKIYTDRARFPEEETVFEAEAENDALPRSNPTVCLMPEDEGIQNRFIYQGPDRSRDFHCMNGTMILGSDLSESDIYIPVPMVSRVHARVEIDARRTILEDLNSTNGTHVNGELLQFHERRVLQKGDIISIAGECYSFH